MVHMSDSLALQSLLSATGRLRTPCFSLYYTYYSPILGQPTGPDGGHPSKVDFNRGIRMKAHENIWQHMSSCRLRFPAPPPRNQPKMAGFFLAGPSCGVMCRCCASNNSIAGLASIGHVAAGGR